MSQESWTLIESDPAVFTELMKGLGIQGTQVEEIYSLEDSQPQIDSLRPIYGLIFLFRYGGSSEPQNPPTILDPCPPNLFYASQIVGNACATQAILSIALNHSDIDEGEKLREFRALTRDFTPALRGQSLSNMDLIRSVHNSFARPPLTSEIIDVANGGESEPVETSEPLSRSKRRRKPVETYVDDPNVYHFTSFVPLDGHVLELDGLQPGPIDLGPCGSMDNWSSIALASIRSRLRRYEASEIRFNLLAVVKDRLDLYNAQLEEAQTTSQFSISQEQSQESRIASSQESDRLRHLIREEQERREKYHAENERRRFNYIPFLSSFLQQSARTDKWPQLVKKARKR